MLSNNIKVAYRNLIRQKAFSLINLAGLTLGITACMLIGLFVRDELQFDRFVPDGDRIYRVYVERTGAQGTEKLAVAPPRVATALANDYPEVQSTLRIYKIASKDLFEAGDRRFYEEGGVCADSTFFDIFPQTFLYGSPVKVLESPQSIVLSKTMARKYFGDTNPVGRTILFQKQPYEVKGVFESNPKFHLALNFILPMSELEVPAERMQSWQWFQFLNYVKLKPNANIESVSSKFTDRIISEIHPLTSERGSTYLPFFQPLHEVHLYSAEFKAEWLAKRGNITYVKALSIIAVFILIIACFNFINLSTATSLKRAKEVGVRKTIGASRSQLIIQFLTETVLLTILSVCCAVILTYILLPALNVFTDKDISLRLFGDAQVFLALLLMIIVVSIAAGIYPALVLAGFKPVKVLKGNALEIQPGKVPWLRQGLVVTQFSLSVLLIISAVVVIRQVNYLHNTDLGFNKDQVLFFPMRGDNMYNNYETFKNELLKAPGVSSVSIGYGFPGDLVAGDGIKIPTSSGLQEHPATQLLVDHDYIKTLGVELIAGRDFSRELSTDKDEAFIINETAVRQLGFGTPQQALGKELYWDVWGASRPDSLKKGKVIGVVKDFHYKSLYDKVETTVMQIFPGANWKVAVKLNGASIDNSITHIRQVWSSFSDDYPLEYSFLDDSFEVMYRAEDKLKSLLWIFTAVTIFVSCLGLLGLAAYTAERRRKEVGIRKVLGASIKGIIYLLSADFIKLVLIALLIASPIAWYLMNQWLADFSYRIEISWWIFILAGLIAVLIALVTVSSQAIRAALMNPVKNLRTE